MKELSPKLFDVLKGYSKEQLVKDIISGIIVAIIALPLSIALAIASGVGPEQGLYTAIIAGFFISFFGGSRVQISGPTAAFATIVAGIDIAAENLQASESRIRDTDMASQMVEFTRDQIVTQAGTAMLAQANAQSQNVLALLQ